MTMVLIIMMMMIRAEATARPSPLSSKGGRSQKTDYTIGLLQSLYLYIMAGASSNLNGTISCSHYVYLVTRVERVNGPPSGSSFHEGPAVRISYLAYEHPTRPRAYCSFFVTVRGEYNFFVLFVLILHCPLKNVCSRKRGALLFEETSHDRLVLSSHQSNI